MDNVVLVQQYLSKYALNVAGALLVLLIGRLLAKLVSAIIDKSLSRMKVDPMLVGFVVTLSYWSVLIFAGMAALSNVGIETASFVAVLAAAGFAVGLSLQGSLSNFASGVMIILLRPFEIGDEIEVSSVRGKIERIEIFYSVLRTSENVKVIVPNAKIFGDVIRNYSAYNRA